MEASTSTVDAPAARHLCPVCCASFPRLEYLTHHMGVHVAENSQKAQTTQTLSCKTCGQGFTDIDELVEHRLSHRESKEKPFKCLKCEQRFSLKSGLKSHEIKCSASVETKKADVPDNPSSEKADPVSEKTDTPDIEAENSVEKVCGSDVRDESDEEPVRVGTRTRKRVVVLDSGSESEDAGKKKKFYCEKCDKAYKSEKMLQRHMKTHNALPLKCHLCNEQFPKRCLLVRHQKQHTANLLNHYKQDKHLQQEPGLDSEEATNIDEATEDEKVRGTPEEKQKVEETLLSVEKRKVAEVEKQKETVIKKKRGRPLRNSVLAKQSEQTDKSGEPVRPKLPRRGTAVKPCDYCGREFDNENLKTIHLRYHTGEKPFACGTCGKGFHTKGNMLAHLRTHDEQRDFQCEECGKEFLSKAALRRHSLTHTGEKPYPCDNCERTFRHWTSLKLHKDRTHFKIKPHACSQCDKAFVSSDALKVHFRAHTGEKPYKCDLCSKTFAQLAGLSAHRRIHTGERPFVCSVCNRGFHQSTALKDHMLTHTGEKPMKCDICGRAFALKCALKRHIRTHTGEKPFKCTVCTKRFPVSAELRLHMRRHTGEKPYQCEKCGQAFSSRSNFKKHVRQHHPAYSLSGAIGPVPESVLETQEAGQLADRVEQSAQNYQVPTSAESSPYEYGMVYVVQKAEYYSNSPAPQHEYHNSPVPNQDYHSNSPALRNRQEVHTNSPLPHQSVEQPLPQQATVTTLQSALPLAMLDASAYATQRADYAEYDPIRHRVQESASPHHQYSEPGTPNPNAEPSQSTAQFKTHAHLALGHGQQPGAVGQISALSGSDQQGVVSWSYQILQAGEEAMQVVPVNCSVPLKREAEILLMMRNSSRDQPASSQPVLYSDTNNL